MVMKTESSIGRNSQPLVACVKFIVKGALMP